MKKKLIYEAPSTELMEIRFEEHFLEGSMNASRNDYTVDGEEDWA